MQFEYTRPPMYQKQFDAVFTDKRYAVIEAGSKTGKTTACQIWLFEKAAMAPVGSRNFWWIAPSHAQARDIGYDRMKAMLSQSKMFEAHESLLKITLIHNGARIWYRSGDRPDLLYGDDVDAAVIDEATRVREASWIAIRSVLAATNGPIRIIGNVKGRRNWAYQLARIAQKGDLQDFHYAKLTVLDAIEGGVFRQSEMDQVKEIFSEAVFNELYMAEASDDGGNPIGREKILACVDERKSTKEPMWFGVDLGKIVDYTVIVGLDEDGHVCKFERFKRQWSETMNAIVEMVGDTPTLIDSTTVGDAPAELLHAANPNIRGFKFSKQSKQSLIDGLAVAIGKRQLSYQSGILLDELLDLEYEVIITDGRVMGAKYGAPRGDHDDSVMALALAQQCRNGQPPVRLWGGAVLSVEEVQAEAELELAERREASEKAIKDGISRWGAWFPNSSR